MQIRTSSAGGVRLVTLSGALTYPDGTALLAQTVRTCLAAGDRDLVIDLTDVPFLDSSGIGEVVASYKRARERGGIVRLAMVARPRDTFVYCGLDRMFDIDDTAERALARFERPRAASHGARLPDASV
jgi:anti-sigma B factor antagonist